MPGKIAFQYKKPLLIGAILGVVIAAAILLFGKPLMTRFYQTPMGRMMSLQALSRMIVREHVYASEEDHPLEAAYMAYFEKDEAPNTAQIRREFKAQIAQDDDNYYGIANCMLSQYDKYSNLSVPELYKEKYPENQNYTGLGISISACGPFIRIASVYADSAAGRAGIEPGDLICTIDGQDIRVMSYSEAYDLLFDSAEDGTTIGILRENETQLLFFDVTSGIVEIPNVSWQIDEEIGYLNIRVFRGESFQSDVKTAMKDFSDAGIKELVLDLRDNRGGLISNLEYLLNALIPEKDVLLFTEHYRRKDDLFHSKGNGTAFDDIVVLVNAQTCSSAEVVAGSLKDMGYLLIGETTYGKAIGLSNLDFYGDKLVLATMTLELPETGDYNDEGIRPNIFVENELENAFVFLLLPLEAETVSTASDQRQIMAMEQRLKLLGYLFSGADGVWDEETDQALQDFCTACGEAYEGTCGGEMLARLDELVQRMKDAQYYEDTQLNRAYSCLRERETAMSA